VFKLEKTKTEKKLEALSQPHLKDVKVPEFLLLYHLFCSPNPRIMVLPMLFVP
jgi:hypothetical protein